MNYLDLAIKIAKANDGAKHYLLGCVALRQDGAVVVASNLCTQTPEPTAHAEARALRKAGHGSTLWVARISKNGEWAMAKPCSRCQALIRNKKVKRVYFTIGKNMIGTWNVEKELGC